ncbi:hypothetical protein OPV22_006900 [Ensete ventricosum]|uniref:Uncharacterized protein n=1 Tax=Ensete ventricosum TaxID=4639 RepID=A0AAV8RTB8_ENSVE|nr:hypothetical protein OPV22_006900 [Ensete ventricosum]
MESSPKGRKQHRPRGGISAGCDGGVVCSKIFILIISICSHCSIWSTIPMGHCGVFSPDLFPVVLHRVSGLHYLPASLPHPWDW